MKTNNDEIGKTDSKKTNSKSKKNGFTRFYRTHQNFREDIFSKAAEKHKTAIAIMAMTGCRPAELKDLIVEKVGDNLKFLIRGAKVNEKQSRGVKERTLTIKIDEKNYSQHLLNEIKKSDLENYLCVELKTTLQAISTEISRTSVEVYKNKYKASSYTFRHAFAEDLKTAKYDKENIAIALGHRSVESQSAYGYKQKSSGVKQEIGIENTSNDKIKTQSKLDRFKIKNKIKKHSFDASKKSSFAMKQQKAPRSRMK